MKKSVFCSKIPEDTRNPKGVQGRSDEAKGRRLPVLRKAPDRERNVFPTATRGDVCSQAEKMHPRFKISPFCPLILVTRRDKMINNMVLSSEIEWIGYEHKRNMLQVEFIVGSVYQYEGVPEVVYKDFLTAPSHGRFFESNIKGKYQVRKVR